MLMVLSPAKALNFAAPDQPLPATRAQLQSDVVQLSRTARQLTLRDLKRLMDLSDNLARLNRDRFKVLDPTSEEGLQAAIAFNGDVYGGLGARSMSPDDLDWAQDHLRILSGLYGLLRPLDIIQPYRLEMHSRVKTRRGDSLYDYWGGKISKALNEIGRDQADPTLVNLASQEYFGAVDRKALKLPLVTCHFRQEAEDGTQRTISFMAKRARGLMARFAVDRRVERAEDLKAFAAEGYAFRPEASTATDWVFARAAA